MDTVLDEGQPPSLLQGVAGPREARLEAGLLPKRASPWGAQGARPTLTKVDGRDVYHDPRPLDYSQDYVGGQQKQIFGTLDNSVSGPLTSCQCFMSDSPFKSLASDPLLFQS